MLWLLMAQLAIDADETALAELQKYSASKPDSAIIYSVAPHTGHPDSLFVYKAIEVFSSTLHPPLRFVSAKDTWNTPLGLRVARSIIGELFLFDRNNLTANSMRNQVSAMADLLNPKQELNEQPESLVIYPQGTRTIGAPIENMPAVLAQLAGVPIAVLNIYNAEGVMPKVPEGMQGLQLIETLIVRLKYRKARHRVIVKLADFIPEGGNLKETKKRFVAAHHQPLLNK